MSTLPKTLSSQATISSPTFLFSRVEAHNRGAPPLLHMHPPQHTQASSGPILPALLRVISVLISPLWRSNEEPCQWGPMSWGHGSIRSYSGEESSSLGTPHPPPCMLSRQPLYPFLGDVDTVDWVLKSTPSPAGHGVGHHHPGPPPPAPPPNQGGR